MECCWKQLRDRSRRAGLCLGGGRSFFYAAREAVAVAAGSREMNRSTSSRRTKNSFPDLDRVDVAAPNVLAHRGRLHIEHLCDPRLCGLGA